MCIGSRLIFNSHNFSKVLRFIPLMLLMFSVLIVKPNNIGHAHYRNFAFELLIFISCFNCHLMRLRVIRNKIGLLTLTSFVPVPKKVFWLVWKFKLINLLHHAWNPPREPNVEHVWLLSILTLIKLVLNYGSDDWKGVCWFSNGNIFVVLIQLFLNHFALIQWNFKFIHLLSSDRINIKTPWFDILD